MLEQGRAAHGAVEPRHGRDLSRQHSEGVSAAIEGASRGLEEEVVSDSWRRSAQIRRIDPESRELPHILPESTLRRTSEPIESVVLAAESEPDRQNQMALRRLKAPPGGRNSYGR
jgi:transcriptional regulator of acetoin/glycerol metabolism